jgi:lipopolysaccharide/colanic/teichoic acid biosynthesis glycosyltransferase
MNTRCPFASPSGSCRRVLPGGFLGRDALRAEWEQNQKLRDDPLITLVGRFLRQPSLNELPQLWNLLGGEMSLAGPRPMVDAKIPKYNKDYKSYRRIRPGMSRLWQVSGRSDISYEERVTMDSSYVRNWSIWLDLVILVRTVRLVLLSVGARLELLVRPSGSGSYLR